MGVTNPDTPKRRYAYTILPFFSSVLYILSFPNFNLYGLAWIALVPLTRVTFGCSSRQAFFLGWLSGTFAYLGLLYWIIVTFQAAHLSLFLAGLCLTLLASYLGLFWGAWAWFVARTKSMSPLWHPIAGAAAWVALEYLRTHLFSGFPWVLWADSQVKFLPLIQLASVTGVYGISFLGLWVTVAVASAPRQWRRVMAPAGAVFLVLGFGLYELRTDHPPSSPEIRVALLQGNIDQYKKWDKRYVEDIQRVYEGLVQDATPHKPDIIIWPETSVPGYLLQDPPLFAWVQKVVRESHTAHLLGAPSKEVEESYNKAFSLNSEGFIVGQYAKRHLVPFGEVVPWQTALGRFIPVLNALGGFTAGKDSPVVALGPTQAGVNICYEALFPNLVRDSVIRGAKMIANLTNDGWYMKTAAPYQHWTPNIYRAVENRRWLVRSDNTGISGIIDPWGHVTAASRIFEPDVVEGIVYARSDLTFYTRFGDLFAWLCVLICLGIWRATFCNPRT